MPSHPHPPIPKLLMNKLSLLTSLVLSTSFAFATAAAAPKSAAAHLANIQKGNLQMRDIGRLSFGPGGLLLAAEPAAAAIVAIDTGDTGPVRKLKKRVDDIEGVVSASVGAPRKDVRIEDMAVNPASGLIYLSVKLQGKPAILTVNADGQVGSLDFKKAAHVKATLPTKDGVRFGRITDLAITGERVIVAATSREEFSNKIYTLPLPLKHGEAADYISAETYHVSHRRWETKAPIQSFIPYEENGKDYVIGAFACTPVAKFPIDDIQPGAEIRGVSVLELGSGNRPRDMFTYTSGGKTWVVTNTERFKTNLFGPSKYWGARIDVKYLDADAPDATNEKAPRRNVKAPSGANAKGIEVVEELFGAILVSQLDNNEVVVVRDTGDTKALELTRLP